MLRMYLTKNACRMWPRRLFFQLFGHCSPEERHHLQRFWNLRNYPHQFSYFPRWGPLSPDLKFLSQNSCLKILVSKENPSTCTVCASTTATRKCLTTDVCIGNFFRMIFEFQRYMSVKRRIVEEEIGVEQDIYGFGGTWFHSWIRILIADE